ncbi:hypothetical protein OAK75_12125 [Bacteriovoracales bacterium]|nr:hypothetical protein [Bacteriovoracales bacterium]
MQKFHPLFLQLAALYNILWGAWIVLFPLHIFNLTGMTPPLYPEIWQCVGMIVGVYGVGYYFASKAPTLHWPITLVGLLGKIFGPIGFLHALLMERFSPLFGLVILTNDLVWWIPFGHILWVTWKEKKAQQSI